MTNPKGRPLSYVCDAKTEKEFWLRFKDLVQEYGPEFDEEKEGCSFRDRLVSNLSYYAGYYDSVKADRILKWLNSSHPFLGNDLVNITPDEALKVGMEMGKKIMAEKERKQRRVAQSGSAGRS
jgi:hypothetical protein